MRSAEWQLSTSRLCEYILSPSKYCPGSDLPRKSWVKLDRLRTGVGRLNADIWRWGLSKSPASDCGADQQTSDHIFTECPLYHPPIGLHGLTQMLMQMQQLLSGFSGSSQRSNYFICFYGFTRKKKIYKVTKKHLFYRTDQPTFCILGDFSSF